MKTKLFLRTISLFIFLISSNLFAQQNQDVEKEAKIQNAIAKSQIPFGEDLCGIWVSDYSHPDDNCGLFSTYHGIPYLVLEISKDSGGYNIRVFPQCRLAKDCKMYAGGPYKYKCNIQRGLPGSAPTCLAMASDYTIDENNELAEFHFGSEKFKKGNEELAKQSIRAVGELGKTLKQINAADLNKSSAKVDATNSAIDLGVIGASALLSLLAEPKTTVVAIYMDFYKLFPGCAELTLEQIVSTQRVEEGKQEHRFNKKMILYKLYPDYDITFMHFGCDDTKLVGDCPLVSFGYKEFSKEELKEKGGRKQFKKIGLLEFNKQSYKKLGEKVTELCEILYPNGQDNGILQVLDKSFKYATKGLDIEY